MIPEVQDRRGRRYSARIEQISCLCSGEIHPIVFIGIKLVPVITTGYILRQIEQISGLNRERFVFDFQHSFSVCDILQNMVIRLIRTLFVGEFRLISGGQNTEVRKSEISVIVRPVASVMDQFQTIEIKVFHSASNFL